MMSEEIQHFELLAEPEGRASADAAPALPVEAPLVRAVRALEALKVRTQFGLPSRDEAAVMAFR